MCGLVGVIGNTNSALKRKMFKTMLWLDTIRGKDSTGVFAVDGEGEVVTMKRACTAEEFLDSKKVDAFLAQSNPYSAIIGHNRAATVGKVNSRNAHPFEHGDITLVHNGTLRNHKTLDSAKDHTVDSEMLCDDINRNGWKQTIEGVDGAFAVIWHDKSNNTLNFMKNSERPLWGAMISDYDRNGQPVGSCMFALASEQWMLEVAAVKSQLMIIGSASRIPDFNQFSIDLNKAKLAFKPTEIIGCTEETPFKEYKRPVTPVVERPSQSSWGNSTSIASSYRFEPTHAYSANGHCFAVGKTHAGVSVEALVTETVMKEVKDGNVVYITAPSVGTKHLTTKDNNKGGDVKILDATRGTIGKKSLR